MHTAHSRSCPYPLRRSACRQLGEGRPREEQHRQTRRKEATRNQLGNGPLEGCLYCPSNVDTAQGKMVYRGRALKNAAERNKPLPGSDQGAAGKSKGKLASLSARSLAGYSTSSGPGRARILPKKTDAGKYSLLTLGPGARGSSSTGDIRRKGEVVMALNDWIRAIVEDPPIQRI
jgi:hypothetical protein